MNLRRMLMRSSLPLAETPNDAASSSASTNPLPSTAAFAHIAAVANSLAGPLAQHAPPLARAMQAALQACTHATGTSESSPGSKSLGSKSTSLSSKAAPLGGMPAAPAAGAADPKAKRRKTTAPVDTVLYAGAAASGALAVAGCLALSECSSVADAALRVYTAARGDEDAVHDEEAGGVGGVEGGGWDDVLGCAMAASSAAVTGLCAVLCELCAAVLLLGGGAVAVPAQQQLGDLLASCAPVLSAALRSLHDGACYTSG